MIVGCGIDVVRVERIQRLLDRFGRRAGERVLGAEELAEWEQGSMRAAFLAKRFAVKEAAAKALGTGFRSGIRYCDISVGHDGLGAPYLHLGGAARRRAEALGVIGQHVSLSDERGLAIAQVILEGATRSLSE